MARRDSRYFMDLEKKHGAHNYHPIPVVISRARGVWVHDPEGRKYLDCLSAYSAVNQGHRHPRIVKALREQANRVTLTSRAFHNDMLGPFLEKLTKIAGMGMALPMNTGAEAVETAIKIARKWGYEKKGVPKNKAQIVVCRDNFHGRTTTIVSFSTDPLAKAGFGPYTPGFKVIRYDEVPALERAITKHTVGFLVEPIQAEAGVRVPSPGYLKAARALCRKNNVLFMLDEIQTARLESAREFPRTNTRSARDYEQFREFMAGPRGFRKVNWCGDSELEAQIQQETSATVRCLLLDEEPPGPCFYTGQPARAVALFAKAY